MSAIGALVAVLMLALVGGQLPAVATPTVGSAAVAAQAEPVAKKNKTWTPKGGVQLNDPLRKLAGRRVIFSQIRKSIDHAPEGSMIRIASWNFNSVKLRRSLIEAHKRGVAVRLLMQRNMAEIQGPRGDFRVLKAALRNDAKRPKAAKNSWARTCNSSCRGGRGILHTKMFLFSEVGTAKDIVMVSSANATDFAATVQWNDMYTVKNRRELYRFFVSVFREMRADRRAKSPYRTFKVDDTLKAVVYPYQKKNISKDRILKRLRKVRCKEADSAGGRTVIRVAQTAWLDARGEAIARRIKKLHNQGCNVRVIYTLAKARVLDVLRAPGGRGPVPVREITQDTDGDGVYDRYLHLKVLTIRGAYGNQEDAYLTINGSENWTKTAVNSDEAGFEVRKKGVTRKYNRYINRLFKNPPRSVPLRARVDLSTIDPYAKVQIH